MINLEDRITAICNVCWLTCTAWVLTPFLATHKNCAAGGSRAHWVEGRATGALSRSLGVALLNDLA